MSNEKPKTQMNKNVTIQKNSSVAQQHIPSFLISNFSFLILKISQGDF